MHLRWLHCILEIEGCVSCVSCVLCLLNVENPSRGRGVWGGMIRPRSTRVAIVSVLVVLDTQLNQRFHSVTHPPSPQPDKEDTTPYQTTPYFHLAVLFKPRTRPTRPALITASRCTTQSNSSSYAQRSPPPPFHRQSLPATSGVQPRSR